VRRAGKTQLREELPVNLDAHAIRQFFHIHSRARERADQE
jgi:hypothetical protein